MKTLFTITSVLAFLIIVALVFHIGAIETKHDSRIEALREERASLIEAYNELQDQYDLRRDSLASMEKTRDSLIAEAHRADMRLRVTLRELSEALRPDYEYDLSDSALADAVRRSYLLRIGTDTLNTGG